MFIWTVSDVMALFTLAILVIVWVLFLIFKQIKQFRCNHVNVFENRDCHAICRDCRKDLGFIGDWRKKQLSQQSTKQ